MKILNKVLYYLQAKIRWVIFISMLLIIAAFFLGITVKNWPLVNFKTELGLGEILDVFTTLLLAFFIPFFIKYFIERSEKVSKLVVVGIANYRNELEKIHLRFMEIYNSESINNYDRNQFMMDFEHLDVKIELLIKIVNRRCGSKVSTHLKNLKTAQFEYWRLLTGYEINSLSFNKIDLEFAQLEMRTYHALMEEVLNLELYVVEM